MLASAWSMKRHDFAETPPIIGFGVQRWRESSARVFEERT
jgi:hypothetical protein